MLHQAVKGRLSNMHIVKMTTLDQTQIGQAAGILTACLPVGWPSLPDALAEIRERLIPENTMLAALEDDIVIGWGGILAPIYGGRVFELHPLAVRCDRQNRGIGRCLVSALEDEARRRGGLTIYLGSDDESEDGETSLAKVDLFADLPDKLRHFRPGTHPTGFYLALGYKIIGVMPDANGRGKPDIFLAKRLS